MSRSRGFREPSGASSRALACSLDPELTAGGDAPVSTDRSGGPTRTSPAAPAPVPGPALARPTPPTSRSSTRGGTAGGQTALAFFRGGLAVAASASLSPLPLLLPLPLLPAPPYSLLLAPSPSPLLELALVPVSPPALVPLALKPPMLWDESPLFSAGRERTIAAACLHRSARRSAGGDGDGRELPETLRVGSGAEGVVRQGNRAAFAGRHP